MDRETDVERLASVGRRIARAASDCGRAASDVTLVCVTKTIPTSRVAPVIAAGARDFGENRVQEAIEKWPALREIQPGVRLRLIGPLQTNKTRDAVATFDAIESLDRPKLAAEIAREIQRAGKAPRLYIQVNIGEEPQKAGVLPRETDGFIAQCRGEYGLQIDGLMCIPPVDQQASPYFALLAKLAGRNGIVNLSMGMTSDFELAIQLGATEVRVGSAIFGGR